MADEHPLEEQLLAFGLGNLAPDEAERIAQHLDSCQNCCDTILNLQDDTFVALVRSSATPGAVANEDLASSGQAQPVVTVDIASGSSGGASGPKQLPPELREHPKFEILGLLGHGGMGDVYEAQHKLMNRVIALKVVKPDLMRSNAAVERFRREVQAAAKLRHANIVTAHDAEQAGDLHYLVMEYVDGENLAEVVSKQGPLAVKDACDYVRQAAEGLQHAHEMGMVHRDIKPHNLMIERQTGTFKGSKTVVKILDFGLANFANEVVAEEVEIADGQEEATRQAGKLSEPAASVTERLTQIGTVMGTADYIAPEQALDARTADIRADIYSLGCTLYMLLTGRAPFSERSVLEKIKAHGQQDPPAISDFRDDVPAEVEAIVRKMTAKNPADRFQTPAEVAEALLPHAVGAPTTQQSTSSRQSESKPVKVPPRRGPRVAVGLAGLALALFAATVFYIHSGRTTLRFEINDPSVKVSFAGETINVDTWENKTFQVEPSTDQEFVVFQNGMEVVTHSMTLRRGEKIALKIDVADGRIKIASREAEIPITPRNPKLERALREALAIQNVDARDAALKQVAQDAADAGLVDILKEAIAKMTHYLKDTTMCENAIRLARSGKVESAYEMVGNIRVWSVRDEAMAALSEITGRPYEESQDAKWNKYLRIALSRAASIPGGQEETTQWLQLLTDPGGSTRGVEGEPLSLLLLKLNPVKAAEANPDVIQDFRFLTAGMPEPSQLAEAMSVSAAQFESDYFVGLPSDQLAEAMPVNAPHGYASMIQPAYITSADHVIDFRAKEGWGTVEFEVPGLYAGKAQFVMELASRMRVVEFFLPNYGITIACDADGIWHRVPATEPIHSALSAQHRGYSVDMGEAIFRVLMHNSVKSMAAEDPQLVSEVSKDLQVPEEVRLQWLADFLWSRCGKSLRLTETDAKKLFAGEFRDEENRSRIDSIVSNTTNVGAVLGPVSLVARQSRRATGWELEFARRLVEGELTAHSEELRRARREEQEMKVYAPWNSLADQVTAAALAKAYFHVLMRKTVDNIAKRNPDFADRGSKQEQLPKEVFLQFFCDATFIRCGSSLRLEDKEAEKLLAGTFRDLDNRRAIEAAVRGNEAGPVPMEAILGPFAFLINQSSTAAGWELEFTRRLIEGIKQEHVVVTQLHTLEQALDSYKLDNGAYPSSREGWKALGLYLAEPPVDPWGNKFGYEFPPTRGGDGTKPNIWSWGCDGKDNTKDDIRNWLNLSESKLIAATQIKDLQHALSLFKLDSDKYPTTNEGLKALIEKPTAESTREWGGPYLDQLPADPWGNEFQYAFPGTRGDDPTTPDIWSLGPDGKDDTQDDIDADQLW